jgi:hypothetical protein
MFLKFIILNEQIKIMWHVLEMRKGFLNNSWFTLKEKVSCKKILRCSIKAPSTDSSICSEKEVKVCASIR